MTRVGVLTVSDRAASGQYEDRSGPAIQEMIAERMAAQVVEYSVVPDESDAVRNILITWSDERKLDLVFTTGGTGFAPRDLTPEATKSVIDREAPGLIVAMLRDSLLITPHAMLSRAVAGIRGHTLIVNLPGSPKAACENLNSILPALPHAMELLQDLPGAEAGHRASVDK